MKVLELEIHNVRGIRELVLKPDGENFVIWGPNGSGKSAVVDALDFLLTGEISRLTGKGTGGLTLGKHGPHIDCEPEEATVCAVVQLSEAKEPIEIQRCMAYPTRLECAEEHRAQMGPVIGLAQRGHHVLTRREILKYITAERSVRSQQILELLNVGEIEELRKTFVRVQNDLGKELQAAKQALDKERGAVSATIQEGAFSEEVVLRAANLNRAILGGQPIQQLHSVHLKANLRPPTVITSGDKAMINTTLLDRDIQSLANMTSGQNRTQIAPNDQELRSLISATKSDPQLLRLLLRVEFIKRGLDLIDETGSCPLCDTPWSPGELRGRLQQQLSAAQVASRYQERISTLSKAIAATCNATIASVNKVVAAAQAMGLTEDVATLQLWLEDLIALTQSLNTPLEKYPGSRFGSRQVQQVLAPAALSDTLSHVSLAAKVRYPEATPEQTAWDTVFGIIKGN